jgi:hypothetical protein
MLLGVGGFGFHGILEGEIGENAAGEPTSISSRTLLVRLGESVRAFLFDIVKGRMVKARRLRGDPNACNADRRAKQANA